MGTMLEDAARYTLVFTGFPVSHWQELWTNNPLEHLKGETRRRTGVAGNFPNRPTARHLVGTVLIGQYDEWTQNRGYITIPNTMDNGDLTERRVS